jgi:hypothetical protein
MLKRSGGKRTTDDEEMSRYEEQMIERTWVRKP